MNKNGLMSKKLKAKRRKKGGTEPTEINEIRCVSPARGGVDCYGSRFPNPNIVESLFTLAQSLRSPFKNKQTSVSEHNPR